MNNKCLLFLSLLAFGATISSAQDTMTPTALDELVERLRETEVKLEAEEDKAHPSYRKWKDARATVEKDYEGKHRWELKNKYIAYRNSSESPEQMDKQFNRLKSILFPLVFDEAIEANGDEKVFLKESWLPLMKAHSVPGSVPGVDFEIHTVDEAWEAFRQENDRLSERAKRDSEEFMASHEHPDWFLELAFISAKGEFYELVYMMALHEYKNDEIRTLENEIKMIRDTLNTEYPEWEALQEQASGDLDNLSIDITEP